MLIHKGEVHSLRSLRLVDLVENEQKTLRATRMKKFAEDSLPALEDADQKAEVAECIRELDHHLSMLCIQKERLVNSTLPAYEQSCSGTCI